VNRRRESLVRAEKKQLVEVVMSAFDDPNPNNPNNPGISGPIADARDAGLIIIGSGDAPVCTDGVCVL
jgi:hypothetical protein